MTFLTLHAMKRESNISCALSEMDDLEKTGTFGTSNQILWDTGTELFKTHKTRALLGKPG